MEKSYEQEYLKAEKTNPWFVCRRELVYDLLKDEKDKKILDFGCGSGQLLNLLAEKGFKRIEGYEPSAEARKQGRLKISSELPDEKFDIILLLDVLEHIKNDKKTIKNLMKLLDKNGKFIISVPAFKFLWSRHDEYNKHYRRYNKKMLRNALEGLEIKRMFYWNFFLFPAMALFRILRISASKNKFDISLSIPFYKNVLKIENWILSKKINLPFGASLFAVANHAKFH